VKADKTRGDLARLVVRFSRRFAPPAQTPSAFESRLKGRLIALTPSKSTDRHLHLRKAPLGDVRGGSRRATEESNSKLTQGVEKDLFLNFTI
jgi:hypothetical protein